MLYNVVLVSAVQQRKTVIIIRISPPLRASLLPDPTPPHPLGCHRAPHQVEPPVVKRSTDRSYSLHSLLLTIFTKKVPII